MGRMTICGACAFASVLALSLLALSWSTAASTPTPAPERTRTAGSASSPAMGSYLTVGWFKRSVVRR